MFIWHWSNSRKLRIVPGPQKYVKQQLFWLFIVALDHYFYILLGSRYSLPCKLDFLLSLGALSRTFLWVTGCTEILDWSCSSTCQNQSPPLMLHYEIQNSATGGDGQHRQPGKAALPNQCHTQDATQRPHLLFSPTSENFDPHKRPILRLSAQRGQLPHPTRGQEV